MIKTIKIDRHLIRTWLTYHGQVEINGSNAANESSHNAYAQNATEFGFIRTDEIVGVGNDGNPITWDNFHKHFLLADKPIGTRNNDSGFWGIGGSVIFPMRFGLHNYVATTIDNKYFIYKYNWDNIDINTSFTYEDVCKNMEGLSVTKNEISKDEYKELVHADKFEKLPKFFFCIKRYLEDSISFSPKDIIKNLNNTFSSARNNIKYFINDNGKILRGNRVWFPTVYNNQVAQTIEDLELVERNVIIAGGIFDVYHYKHQVTENSVKNAFEIQKVTDGYENIFKPIRSKASAVYNHFFDKERLWLTSESLGQGIMKAVLYNYSNMVFLQVGGDFKYSTVKSDKLDDKLSNESIVYHKNFIDSNKIKQHKGNKGEDSKVIECYNEIIDGKPKCGNLLSSIQLLSDYTLNPKDIGNELNHLQFRPIVSREHDWCVKKTDEDIWTLHLEFMNNKADWDHIDKLNFTLDEDGIPYQVLIVDSLSKHKEKINSFKKVLSNKDIPTLKMVWVITLDDFYNYNQAEMIKGKIFDAT